MSGIERKTTETQLPNAHKVISEIKDAFGDSYTHEPFIQTSPSTNSEKVYLHTGVSFKRQGRKGILGISDRPILTIVTDCKEVKRTEIEPTIRAMRSNTSKTVVGWLPEDGKPLDEQRFEPVYDFPESEEKIYTILKPIAHFGTIQELDSRLFMQNAPQQTAA